MNKNLIWINVSKVKKGAYLIPRYSLGGIVYLYENYSTPTDPKLVYIANYSIKKGQVVSNQDIFKLANRREW